MNWPALTDFSQAVQSPQLCFKGTDLESGRVKTNPRGMPLVYSGAFACVYPVSVGGTTYAVRCFTREVSDQESRYNQLSNYLLNVLPPSFVGFEYLDHGISFQGAWYPIVKMEWVDGEQLSKFVDSNLNDPAILRRVAAQWRGGPNASLRGLRIAHNDLQHGNVMVQADGRIRLVDYDGMFLPQFKGEDSPEMGHKNYQHPKRSLGDYGDYVDNFPSLVIYLSLLALAADPGLWSFYNDDNLVLTREDYEDPSKSQAFRKLKGSPDPMVVELTKQLERYCGEAVEDVPDLETILSDIGPVASPSTAPRPQAGMSSPAGGGRRQVVMPTQPSPSPPAAAPAPAVRGRRQVVMPTRASPSPTPAAPAPAGRGRRQVVMPTRATQASTVMGAAVRHIPSVPREDPKRLPSPSWSPSWGPWRCWRRAWRGSSPATDGTARPPKGRRRGAPLGPPGRESRRHAEAQEGDAQQGQVDGGGVPQGHPYDGPQGDQGEGGPVEPPMPQLVPSHGLDPGDVAPGYEDARGEGRGSRQDGSAAYPPETPEGAGQALDVEEVLGE